MKIHFWIKFTSYGIAKHQTFFYRVELPPEGPVLAVILGGVEVTGHTPRLHFLEQIPSLRKCPWPTVETLDNTTEKRPRGVGVRLLRLTRARHCRSEGRYWSINKLRKTI